MGFHEKNYDQILLFESQEGEKVNIIEPVLAQVIEYILFPRSNLKRICERHWPSSLSPDVSPDTAIRESDLERF